MRDDRRPFFDKKGRGEEKKEEQGGYEMLDDASQEFLTIAATKETNKEKTKEEYEKEIITALYEKLQQRADVNAQDRFGNTALHYAVREGQLNLAMFLFKNGAKPNIKNKSGQSANSEIAKLSDESENPTENKMFALFALYAYMQELQQKVDNKQTKTTGFKKLDKLIKEFFNAEVGYNVAETHKMVKDLWSVLMSEKKASSLEQDVEKLNSVTKPVVRALYKSFADDIKHIQQKEQKEQKKQEMKGRRKVMTFDSKQLEEEFSKEDQPPSPQGSPKTGRRK